MSPLVASICVIGRVSWTEGTESVKLGVGGVYYGVGKNPLTIAATIKHQWQSYSFSTSVRNP